MTEIIMEFPLLPPSLNDWLKMSRRIRAKQSLKRAMHFECLCALHRRYGPGGVAWATQPRRLTITVIRRRLLDHDNFVGGCKPLVDVLVNLGLLIDDRPSALIGGKGEYYQEKAAGRQPMTRVEIAWEEKEIDGV